MKTIKELADIGAAAAFVGNKYHYYVSVSEKAHSWGPDEPARQAFAQAVKEAVLAGMLPKSDSGTSKIIPLDINDIRATDEFRPCGDVDQLCPLIHAGKEYIRIGINHGFAQFNYAELAANYLRRQHGSTEWKPCTKDEVK